MPTYMMTSGSPMPNCCDPCATMDPCSGMGGATYTTTPDAGNF